MASSLPEPLAALVERIARLPGLGPKSAMRAAMTLLQWPESETRDLGRRISEIRDALCLCSRCGGLASHNPCPICSDPNRDTDTLCVVPEWDSMLAMEKGGFYRGQYFVLGGLLETLRQKDGPGLETDKLLARLADGSIKELILALGSTLEAENTAAFLKNLLQKSRPDLKISRLAQGMPLGAQVKFMDYETLRQSMKYRQEF